MNNIAIICNDIGTGKTTFALNKYKPNIYYSYEPIEDNPFEIMDKIDTKGTYCIIDSVDSIPEILFNGFMNHIKSLEWKAIILIFDVVKSELVNIQNFNIIWECGLLSLNYEYSNFRAEKSSFYDYFHKNYPELKINLYDRIIETVEFNFKKIDRLMLINQLNSERKDEIDTNALAKYIDETIHDKYSDIPDADSLLKKASIIGEQFLYFPLESPDGFGYQTASAILKQMDELHIFIRSCIKNNSYYEFISHDVYQGIFNSISIEKKISWINILVEYYKSQYEHLTNISERLSLLNKLNDLYKLLPTCIYERKQICYMLLYYYQKSNNLYHIIETLTEIIESFKTIINPIELCYFSTYQIQLFMENGEYSKALKILKEYYSLDNFPGSKMLIKYYYAYCLYSTGNIDLSYKLTKELVGYLKFTSGANSHPQQLFCMTYSLMATIQNHLGLGDNGIRYFRLALNNATSKLSNKTYRYLILKKCDMFYGYEQIKKCLRECLFYFEKNRKWSYAGEVSVNLATEMMFQDCEDTEEIKTYFENSIDYFRELKSEKLAYAWNNFGIYAVISENNIQKGLDYFQNALLVGLSDFTYMTIYLNICMCLLLMNQVDSEQFMDARIRFDFAKKKLNKRKNESLYENIYATILDIIIDEYQGKNVIPRCQSLLNSKQIGSFFIPLLSDIIKRNQNENDSVYMENNYFYTKMNEYHCFFAEFRFWE